MKYKILLIVLLFCVISFSQSYSTHSYGEHPQQVYDIYFPENYNEQTPVVIFIHGGGWQAEHRQRDYYRSFVQRLFNAGENIVVNIDYRLITQHNDIYVFPDQIDDIELAINHIKTNYNLTPNPIVLTGNSAGGHLATWYYLNQVTEVQKVIPIAAPYDGSVEVAPGVMYFQIGLYPWIQDKFINVEHYGITSVEEGVALASPHTYANSNLDEIYYFHMTSDPLHQLEAILRDYPNIPTHTYRTSHSGWLNQPHRNDLIQRMIDYIGVVEVCEPPSNVVIRRTSHTTASFNADGNYNYQGTANRANRPLRPYPMYGMENMIVPHIQTGLVPAFDYDVWFRTICGEDYSEWSEAYYLPKFQAPTENVRYFNLQGQEIRTEQKGINIITDGETSIKIYKK